ncbi:uncharacterized protein LOC122506909 isoform X2 [Leptopilina heterotoma]|uniref:uncharacterized protein LOC122506909 isoform X2 n=1 Tax=Leptopilina heterotoma TaxID=63436 RepID=UPI001CAA032B|nr:uncharacterized protein LOC122506909 isoform X2 [Leptopilina heterotoma]
MKDIRERQFVSKLDRYQLEDKYLRVLEEMESLKKQSNQQEDKLKRLTTKLMRVSANPSAFVNLHDICNDKERISALECENNKLKNKVNVLRNQLLCYVNQRLSPKKFHKFMVGTPKTEKNSKLKTDSSQFLSPNNEEDLQKFQELESQSKEMTFRISELESELVNRDTENQREKIADNIKHIRNLRYINECTGQLVVFENENKSLKLEVENLRKLLADTKKINKEMTSSLLVERKKLTEMDLQIFKTKDSELSLREKDEQIQDLMNEIKILQQHNSELIALSTKYSNVEIENLQLTNKISDHVNNNEVLKNALNNEQANSIALQTANSQLLLKLNELQRNVDTLTIQLTTYEEISVKQKSTPKKKERDEKYSYSPQASENIPSDLSKNKTKHCTTIIKEELKLRIEKESQTENSYLQKSENFRKKENEFIQPIVNSEIPERRKQEEINRNTTNIQNGNTLSPERMLKLLEQAQISNQIEMQNNRLKQVDPISESIQKQRLKEGGMKFIQDLETMQYLSRHIVNYCSNIIPFKDPNQILFLFSEILKDYNSSSKFGNKNNVQKTFIDSNNNETELEPNYRKTGENVIFQNYEIFKSKLIKKEEDDEDEKSEKEKSECFCICDGRCPNYFYKQTNEKCVCCCIQNSKNSTNCESCSKGKNLFENIVSDVNSIKQTFHKHPNLESKKKQSRNYNSKLLDNSILITKDQGLLEVHIVRLQLSKSAVRLLYQDNDLWKASFFISWDIEDQKTSFTPVMNYPNLNFDSSSIFVVLDLYNFLHYIFEKYITFRVHAFYPNKVTHTVAETKICIKEIIDYPHNKMQYISSVTSVIPCSYGTNFGYLSLWIRLGCDLNKIETFKNQREIVSESSKVTNESKDNRQSINSTPNKIQKEKAENYLSSETESDEEFIRKEGSEKEEMKNFTNRKVVKNENEKNFEIRNKRNKNSLFRKMAINSNTSTISTNSVFSENDEFFQENEHLKILEELKAKMTKNSDRIVNDDIMEFNMLSNKSQSDNTLYEVLTDDNWDKYKIKNFQTTNNRDIDEESDDSELEDDETYSLHDQDKKLNCIIIELKSIRLFKESTIFLNPNIVQLYIEYSFLGYFGKDMETYSVPVPESPMLEMKYNFKKEFQIDGKNHSKQREILRKMLTGHLDPCINFILVSEPLPEEQFKDCEEVGFAKLNLKDYVLGNYTRNMSLLIKNINQTKNVGHLRITVDGIEAMKNCL